MTYVIPHFRYGALIFHNIDKKNRQKREKFDRIEEDIQRILNQSVKRTYDLPISSPNQTIYTIMGNWNMKTLSYMSYIRSANTWLK